MLRGRGSWVQGFLWVARPDSDRVIQDQRSETSSRAIPLLTVVLEEPHSMESSFRRTTGRPRPSQHVVNPEAKSQSVSLPDGVNVIPKIHPFTRRRRLKLKVSRTIRGIGREKNLANIAVPESECLSISHGISRNHQRLLLRAHETNVKRFIRPANPRFRMPRSRRRLAGPVVFDLDWLTLAARSRSQNQIQRQGASTKRATIVVSESITSFKQSSINSSGSSLWKHSRQCCVFRTFAANTQTHQRRRQFPSGIR